MNKHNVLGKFATREGGEFRSEGHESEPKPTASTPVKAAVEETNPSVFERLVFETEDAIWHRLRELSKNPGGLKP